MHETLRDRFHVILVEPQKSLNIGAVARAMTNLGFHHLHLVAPPQYDRERAESTACWATPLLDTMLFHETFEEAIADVEVVVGLSGKDGKAPAHYVTLPEWTGVLPGQSVPKTALVFGTEDSGLRQEHLNLCRWVVRIPAAAENPSFNLAQSVLLTLWEITKAFPTETIPGEPEVKPTTNDYFQLDRLLDAVMKEGGFIRDGSPTPASGTIKSLFHRLDLSPQEMGVLLGLFGRLNSTLRRQKTLPPSNE